MLLQAGVMATGVQADTLRIELRQSVTELNQWNRLQPRVLIAPSIEVVEKHNMDRLHKPWWCTCTCETVCFFMPENVCERMR